MSLTVTPGRFGAGGAEPWSTLLRGGAAAVLELVRPDRPAATERMDAARWLADADAVDRALLADLPGPVLDIGCGPGRMLRAAADRRLAAWGLDADGTAVAMCRAQGLPVLHGSVFDGTPGGGWGSVLLLDGNIGIGGDVAALLARCAELLRPGGIAVVEAHPDRRRDVTEICRLRGADGGESEPFAWSEVGLTAVLRAAEGFHAERSWRAGGRVFVRLRRR